MRNPCCTRFADFPGPIADYLNLPDPASSPFWQSAQLSTFRWDAGEDIFRAHTDFVAWPPILSPKERFASADRSS